jgi:pentapeptide MXKDX repeat protein
MSKARSLAAATRPVLLAIFAGGALYLAISAGALAAEPTKADTAKNKPMNLDEPMEGGMKKEGMKKGDVKKAAEKKDREMRKKIEKEQQSVSTVKK